jgi:DNA processing protein
MEGRWDQPRAGQNVLPYCGVMSASAEEHAALVALLRALAKGEPWSSVAEEVLATGSALAVWERNGAGAMFPDPARASLFEEALTDVGRWADEGWRMLGILDEGYPARVREIHQVPPFLFAVGQLLDDDPAISVVGSRKASPHGLSMAAEIATALASEGITVLAGLAAGVDAAGHSAALAAGGRTVGIIGSGIARYYPPANKDLQDEIASRGLVLSQFWPEAAPMRPHFLMRNAVMSGYGRATVVVEASETSGTRAQARMAVEHGRPVILMEQVVASTEWAQSLVGRPGVYKAASPDEVMGYVRRILERDSNVDRLVADLLAADQ